MRIQITRKNDDGFIIGHITLPKDVYDEHPIDGINVFEIPDDQIIQFNNEPYRFKIYRKKLKYYEAEIDSSLKVKSIEDQLYYEIEKFEKFEKHGIDTKNTQIKIDQLKSRLKELSE